MRVTLHSKLGQTPSTNEEILILWLYADGKWLRNMCWIDKRAESESETVKCLDREQMSPSQINPPSHRWTRSINSGESHCKPEQSAKTKLP